MAPTLALHDVAKTFTLHLRGGLRLPVVSGVSLVVRPGECVVLGGPSGAGKSSLLKIVYGNYRADAGRIEVRDGERLVDIARAEPREVLVLRQRTIGYVSQFLRVIPHVPALEVVASAARAQGVAEDIAGRHARDLLRRLHIPERLWALPPATFSGGEQQRVNIARGFIAHFPLLLLDEPTASLDRANREVVMELIREKKARGVAILGIFHDEDVRDAVADRVVDVTRFAAAQAGTPQKEAV